MKLNRWFVAGVLAFMLLMFAVELHMPKRFVWRPTFSHWDKQPFGCALLDSLITASWSCEYSLSDKTFYQLAQGKDSATLRSYLLLGEDVILKDADLDAMLSLAERGNSVMLAGMYFNSQLLDTLQCYGSFYVSYFRDFPKRTFASLKKDSIWWSGDAERYSPRWFSCYPTLLTARFEELNVRSEVLAFQSDSLSVDGTPVNCSDNVLAVAIPWGKGKIVLVATPLLLTNYGVIDSDNVVYIFRLLSQLKEAPLVRIEAYVPNDLKISDSPFSYFLSQKPLRWALYLTLLTILLFMLFTARRRQRAIPVILPPKNKSLEFVKLIGTLYYQKKDHADLVRKKYLCLVELLRREFQVDIEEVHNDVSSFAKIAQKTGMNREELETFIHEIRPVIYGAHDISSRQMKYYIDKINQIITLL